MLEGLREWRILSLQDADIRESVEETENTFAGNARIKSLFYSLRCPGYVLADDSGLEVPVLGGRPGVLSARYAGKGANDKKNISLLLTELEGVDQRRARFVAVCSLAYKGEEIALFQGEVWGEILVHPAGDSGFGYDPVFFYPPFQKSFAQISREEKNRVSHRGEAMRKLREYLAEKL